MKPAVRSIITDLKAAVRIGHPDAIFAALEGLGAQSEIASNQVMTDDDVSQLILPVGLIISHPRTPTDALESLANDPLAAFRAIAAVSSAHRFLRSGGTNTDTLTQWAKDPRSDIRVALVKALATYSADDYPIVPSIAKKWLSSEHLQVKQSGLQLVANLSVLQAEDFLHLIAPIGNNSTPETNNDIVAALLNLAQQGASVGVLSLLSNWTKQSPPNAWVITRTLSGSWAAEDPHEALYILKSLAAKNAAHKQVVSALRALIRHDAADAVQTEMEKWRASNDENLPVIAEKIDQ